MQTKKVRKKKIGKSLDRRLMQDTYGRNSPYTKRKTKPGIHGNKPGYGSDQLTKKPYVEGLTERKRFAAFYGLSRGKLYNIVKKYVKNIPYGADYKRKIIIKVESFLLTILIRAGLSIGLAKQVINHGQVYFKKKRVSFPYYVINSSDEIEFSKKALKKIWKYVKNNRTIHPPHIIVHESNFDTDNDGSSYNIKIRFNKTEIPQKEDALCLAHKPKLNLIARSLRI